MLSEHCIESEGYYKRCSHQSSGEDEEALVDYSTKERHCDCLKCSEGEHQDVISWHLLCETVRTEESAR